MAASNKVVVLEAVWWPITGSPALLERRATRLVCAVAVPSKHTRSGAS